MSWLTLSNALWLMPFHPTADILLMSKRDDESSELLANRLTAMHARLPEYMAWIETQRSHRLWLVACDGLAVGLASVLLTGLSAVLITGGEPNAS